MNLHTEYKGGTVMENRDRQLIFRFKKEYEELIKEVGEYRAKIIIAKKVRKILEQRKGV